MKGAQPPRKPLLGQDSKICRTLLEKNRTVSEPFRKFFTVSELFYRFGSFFGALWDRLNQFSKLVQAIT